MKDLGPKVKGLSVVLTLNQGFAPKIKVSDAE